MKTPRKIANRATIAAHWRRPLLMQCAPRAPTSSCCALQLPICTMHNTSSPLFFPSIKVLLESRSPVVPRFQNQPHAPTSQPHPFASPAPRSASTSPLHQSVRLPHLSHRPTNRMRTSSSKAVADLLSWQGPTCTTTIEHRLCTFLAHSHCIPLGPCTFLITDLFPKCGIALPTGSWECA